MLLRVTPSSPLSIAAGAPVIKKLANVTGGGPAAKRVYKEALLPRSQRAAASRGGQKLKQSKRRDETGKAENAVS